MSALYPVSAWGTEYLVPSLGDETSNDTAFLLTTNQTVTLLSGPPTKPLQLQSSQELPFYPSLPGGSVQVKTSSPVFLTLYRPGLLLNLIPTASFSSCYLIYALNSQKNQALLIVPTAQTNGVYQESTAMTLTWTPMTGTGYSWGLADLGTEEKRHIIWHNTSIMAAYYLGETNNKFFGNPATSLSTDPDSNGCLVKPGLVKLGDKQQGWIESLNYCQNLGYNLVSLNTQEVLLSIAKILRESEVQAHGQGWIGLRRSSLTGQWYWLTKQNVLFTHWDVDEPGTPMEGQCAMMMLDPHGNYTWSDQSCCEALPAVCYKTPIYLSLQ
ncbi:uncharacterized protein LOC109614795 [Esox lucius]|uniref:uncharacterized protein LOC109614795 n=1 Tax=Esox lucius TaxID=8010 RepID=UPI00097345ED|nr:uncharacterized protein LOC109614795 [Esox lucius]